MSQIEVLRQVRRSLALQIAALNGLVTSTEVTAALVSLNDAFELIEEAIRNEGVGHVE